MSVPGLNPVRMPAIRANLGSILFPGFAFTMAGMDLPDLKPGVVSFAGHPQACPRIPSGPPNAGYGISQDMSQNNAQQ